MEKNKKESQTREQIFYNFIQILDSFPQYTISQHLSHILRKKEEVKAAYFWSDQDLLKKFEQYYDELNNELVLNSSYEEVDN